jgi:haloalkane dehalogenase
MNNSKFIEVNMAKLHYIDQGVGQPIVFLHGIPTSSYLWRNVTPNIADKARCIALDFIGMGSSDKPDIKYDFFDHVKYFEGFIDTLGLTNITLVLHGLLGSAVGFYYAMRHKDNVKAIAFYEAYVRPMVNKKMLSLPIWCLLRPLLQDSNAAYKYVMNDNFLVDKLLPHSSYRPLSAEIMENYRRPFATKLDRKPLWQFIQDFFVGKNHQQVLGCVAEYSKFLQETDIPKLMLYTVPGFVTTMNCVEWCRDNLPNLQIADLDEGLYLAPESNSKIFGQILRDWYLEI